MKKLITIFAIIFALAKVNAADLVTATITITNAPTTNGMTFVCNGSTRTWTNAVFNTSTQILTNSSIGGVKTNLMLHIGGTGFGGLTFLDVGTNSFKLIGTNVTVSFTGAYGSVSYTTNTTGVGQLLRLPFTSQSELTNRTNNASWLVDGLNSYPSNSINTNASAFSNYVNIGTSSQTITGAKTFSGATIISNVAAKFVGGIISNAVAGFTNGTITNVFSSGGTNQTPTIVSAVSISGNLGNTTNGTLLSPTITNGIITGTFDAAGATLTNASFYGQIVFDNGQIVITNSATANLNFQNGGMSDSWAIQTTAANFQIRKSGIGALFYVTTNGAYNIVGFGDGSAVQLLLTADATVSTNLVEFKTSGGTRLALIDQTGHYSGGISNATYRGTNNIVGDLSFTWTNNTAQAAGDNSATDINRSVKVWLQGMGASAFTTAGIAGGREGRVVTLWNTNGATWTIGNQDGAEATAANRIKTGTGGDVTITNNPGYAEFEYNATDSRWWLKDWSRP